MLFNNYRSQLRLLLIFVLAVGAVIVWAVTGFSSAPIKFSKVISGDIVAVEIDGNVEEYRLFGVDAPEMKQDYGVDAYTLLSSLLQGKLSEIQLIGDRKKKKKLRIRIVKEGGVDVGHEMVRLGLAWWDNIAAPDDTKIARLEAEARQSKRGLWQGGGTQAPWLYRQGMFSRSIKLLDDWTECSEPSRYCPTLLQPHRCELIIDKDNRRFVAEAGNACLARRQVLYQSCRAGLSVKTGRNGIDILQATADGESTKQGGKLFVRKGDRWKRRIVDLTCVADKSRKPVPAEMPKTVEEVLAGEDNLDQLLLLSQRCQRDSDCSLAYLPECQYGCTPPCGEVHSVGLLSLNMSPRRSEYLQKLIDRERKECLNITCKSDCSAPPPSPPALEGNAARCVDSRCQVINEN